MIRKIEACMGKEANRANSLKQQNCEKGFEECVIRLQAMVEVANAVSEKETYVLNTEDNWAEIMISSEGKWISLFW